MKNVALFTITENIQEMRSLLDTLNYKIIKEYLQKRAWPHRTSYLGPGRIEEIKKEIEGSKPDLIVVNGSLKPSQHHFLEMEFQMECLDRPGVILRIFAEHAHTPEAIAQVTLAKLRYELPFLREWIHKAKSGDRPGFLAGGAYATDVYFEHAKTHARRIERNLEELSKQREITRTKRRATGYSLVSLAGYTNAGKSALMNALCNSNVEVDARLFSTLSTTTRKISGAKGNILVTDTVGFIKDLPPDLINAFNSTLEEIYFADLILLVLDVSESEDIVSDKLRTSLDILQPRIENRDLVVVGNKVDLLNSDEKKTIEMRVTSLAGSYDVLMVSAKNGEGLESLRERILRVQGYTCDISCELPLSDEAYSLMSRLRSMAGVSTEVIRNQLHSSISCRPEDAQKIRGWLEAVGGTKISTTCEGTETLPEGARASSGNEGAPLKS